MSHKDFENIEELFRSGLEDMEVPVNDTMWSAISKNITSSGSSAASASGLTSGGSLMTYLGLAGAACVVGVVGTLLYTNIKNESVIKEVLSTEVSAQQFDDQEITNEVAHLTEVTETTDIEVVPASQEDRNIVEEIVTPVTAVDPIVKENQDKPKKTVVVVEEKSHDYGNSWVEYFLTPSNGKYTEPVTTSSTSESIVSVVKPTITEVKKDEIIASIVAAPVGGYAPLEVTFAHHSESGSVSWDFGDGTTSEESSPAHIFEKYGKYTVTLTITDKNGDKYQDFRVIEVLANSALTKIPNVFTPNNDGANDEYKVEGKNIESFSLAILNTKGEILYQSNSIEENWDGRDKFGEELPVGTYVVVISARGIDGKKYEHSGTVTLSR
ncbi:MAG: gliding motility-associated C-terminal domain-containing protein [Flavobacteriales bacterium]|nr:gliding motility-associated C-terminal domain-containing protein [Flavobacteriales bacterium]